MMRRTTLREIKASLGRYLAILAIVALGVGFFSGVKITKEAMVYTLDEQLDRWAELIAYWRWYPDCR